MNSNNYQIDFVSILRSLCCTNFTSVKRNLPSHITTSLLVTSVLTIISCDSSRQQYRSLNFHLLRADKTGVDFSNILKDTEDFNIYTYRNYYNGGGVAIGDINNDGLADLYLTANQKSNKLYLNKGNFEFEDITNSAGVGGTKFWSTGVSMVDINHDGYLDIYVCNSGRVDGGNKQNELFINNQDLTFYEATESYGLDDRGFSTHASFFDYDKDGDLDVYLLNNSYQAIGSFDLRRNERPLRDSLGGDKLLENQDGKFVDVSEKAGIYGSVIGFGLGVNVSDFNNDGWQDIFVANDFFERDYLYLNNANGTFDEVLTQQMKSITGASMGADVADLDSDGFMDLFVTEMLPVEYQRLKSVTTFEDWNKYQYNVANGYHHQFTRNMLYRNNANSSFSELGRLAGVAASDWSWGALFFDMNNNGYSDLFIANGIFRDLTDQDYLQYMSNKQATQGNQLIENVNFKELVDLIPSNKVQNHAYLNKGDFQFDRYADSGLELPSFSNGSAYGDLDNDGDLDLVVNNVNMELFVFENKAENYQNSYLQIELVGKHKNTKAIGAKIEVHTDDKVFYREQQLARGFQSSVDPVLTFGLGQVQNVDIKVVWPSGIVSHLDSISTNRRIRVFEDQATESLDQYSEVQSQKVFTSIGSFDDYRHIEKKFVDFHRERLTFHKISTEGPDGAVGDLNGDGRDDLVIPGSKGEPTTVFISQGNGLVKSQQEVFQILRESEHVEAKLFDVEGDGDLDLYLAAGGVETSPFSDDLFDRLLINDGNAEFSLTDQMLPDNSTRISTGAVAVADINKDGYTDLFIGERTVVGFYGLPGNGYILLGDGTGKFEDKTEQIAPDFQALGMITDALFHDWDNDGDMDLMVTGEFMGIEVFENDSNQLSRIKNNVLSDCKGWWKKLALTKLNSDGKTAVIATNHGLNSRFKASKQKPIKLFVNDFDKNGSFEGIITFRSDDGRDLPYVLRHDLIEQIKMLAGRFPSYKSFKNASITDIFTHSELETSLVYEVNTLESVLIEHQKDFEFKISPLPTEAQISPMYAVLSDDWDDDGDFDLLLGGNLYGAKPEVGIYDASNGVYLEYQDGKFKANKQNNGFHVKGEVRDIEKVNDLIYVLRSNDSVDIFRYVP